MKKTAIALCLLAVGLFMARAEGISTPVNLFDGEGAFYDRSGRYTSVTVNGTDVPVMDGYNRSGDYLEYDILRYTSAPGKNTMTITCPDAINSISISPKKLNIIPEKISSNSYRFDVPDPVDTPYYLYATINGNKLVILRDETETAPSGEGVWNVGDMLNGASVNARSQAMARRVAQKIQEAIDAASQWGASNGKRGVVYVPAGLYYMSNIILKSDVEFFLSEGAVLRATDNKSDYRVDYHKNSLDRDGTWWISTVNDPENPSKNVRICGHGVIDANGYYYQKRLKNNADRFGITALHIIHAENVEVDGITVMQTPMWGTMLGRSNDIVLTNVKFLNSTDANENDGIDVNESQRVLVDRSIGIALDDPYSTKTWMGQELFKNWTGEPEALDDVTFNHCVSWSYCGAFKMGHGAQQRQTNVKILNGVVLNSGRAIGIEPKYANTEPNVGGFWDVLVENVDIEHAGGEGWLKILAETPNVGNPPVKNVTLRNINIRSKGSASSLRGVDENNIIDGVTFDNVHMYGNSAPVTTLAELNITNVANYRNVRFEQSDAAAHEYLLEAEYFNKNSAGSVALMTADNADADHGGAFVQNVTTGNHLCYNDVDFGSNTSSISLRYMSKRSAFEAVLHLDAIDGKEIGRVSLAKSAVWADAKVDLEGALGKHDLYVVLNKVSGPSSAIDGLNYLRLENRTFVNLEAIKVASKPVEVNVGTFARLDYSLVPENAYQTDVMWEMVDGADVLSLDKYGNVRGLKTGHATVRVVSEWNPEIYADIEVAVVDKLKFANVRIEAESASALYDTYHYDNAIAVGSVSDPEDEGGIGVNGCWDTNFAVYENVDLLDGAVEVAVRKNVPRSSAMEIWLDPQIDAENKGFSGGTQIADVEFTVAAPAWTVWETFTAPVVGLPSGIHTVVLRFKSAGTTNHNQNLAGYNWIEFKAINKRGELQELQPVEGNVTVNKHLQTQLEVRYVPENALERDLVWSVVPSEPEGEAVVEVSAKGVVKGLKAGVATVRATSASNELISADFHITVEDNMDELKVRIETEDADAVYDTYHFGNQSSISVGDVSDPEEEDARGLNSCWHGNFAVYENVDFHDAVYSASVRKNYVRGSKMEMWIDPEIDAESKSFTGGTLVGTVEYPKPEKDDWSRWQTFEMPVEGAPSGVHTVVLRFLAGGGSAADKNYGALNWIEFQTLKKAPQGPIVIEAESWDDQKECKVADLNGEGTEASGGKGWGSDNAHKGAYATYTFNADEECAYDLSVWYVTMNTRWMSVQINDNPANIICCDELTGNWNGVPSADRPGVASKTIRVWCREGENSMTLRPVYGYSPEEGRDQPYSPNVDRVVLEKVAVAMKEPAPWTEADRLKYEIEDYSSTTGKTGTSNRAAFSNGKGGEINQDGGTLIYDVTVPADGVYLMNIAYATGQRRWITVSANGGEAVPVGFLQTTNSWGENAGDAVYNRSVLVYLFKGDNVITLGQYTKEGQDNSESAFSPVLDCFTLDLVDYPAMSEANRKGTIYPVALSDVATWSSDFDDNIFADHNEYTESVAEANEATVTAQFPWPVLVSGYAFATTNDASAWTVEISADGENWKNAGEINKTATVGRVTTVTLNSPYADMEGNAARYVRLSIAGEQPAALGEFMVFGNPYASSECHVPSGVLAQNFTNFETTHVGFDSQSWHEGIDKMFNGMCNDRFTVAQSGDGGMGDYDDITIQLHLTKAVAVESYMLGVHYNGMMERNPAQWELYRGPVDSADGSRTVAEEDWALLDSRENMNFVVPGSTLPIHIDNESAASDYKLVIKNRRDKATHLAAFQMFAKSGSTGIEANDADGFSIVMVAGGNGAVEIASDEERPYNVYNMTGVGVSAGSVAGVARVELPHGIYVVAVGTKTFKVVVK